MGMQAAGYGQGKQQGMGGASSRVWVGQAAGYGRASGRVWARQAARYGGVAGASGRNLLM